MRSAIGNQGFEFPARRITVNLAPAWLRKAAPGFDLAIAAAILAASAQVEAEELSRWAVFGELSLSGELRGCRGALAVAEGARRAGCAGSSCRATVRSRRRWWRGSRSPGSRACAPSPRWSGRGGAGAPPAVRAAALQPSPEPDLADVRGQRAAAGARDRRGRRPQPAAEGPPGTGKTMLARRLPSILPPLDAAEALEVTGSTRSPGCCRRRRADRARRSARRTTPSRRRPGRRRLACRARARSRWRTTACCSWTSCRSSPRTCLEVLRQPLEDGRVAIVRGPARRGLPGRFMLVAAMNPCPCGFAATAAARVPVHRRRGRALPAPAVAARCWTGSTCTSAFRGRRRGAGGRAAGGRRPRSRERVVEARARQAHRLGGCQATCNGDMDPATLRDTMRPSAARATH